jgi:hypothetical protein
MSKDEFQPATEEQKKWHEAYVNRMIERGVNRALAEQTYEAGEHDFSEGPVDAADDELSYWVG